MSIDLDDLRAKAAAATPGPWEARVEHAGYAWIESVGHGNHVADVEFIAAANPAVVLALVDKVERLRAAIRALQTLPGWMEANGLDDQTVGFLQANVDTMTAGVDIPAINRPRRPRAVRSAPESTSTPPGPCTGERTCVADEHMLRCQSDQWRAENEPLVFRYDPDEMEKDAEKWRRLRDEGALLVCNGEPVGRFEPMPGVERVVEDVDGEWEK